MAGESGRPDGIRCNTCLWESARSDQPNRRVTCCRTLSGALLSYGEGESSRQRETARCTRLLRRFLASYRVSSSFRPFQPLRTATQRHSPFVPCHPTSRLSIKALARHASRNRTAHLASNARQVQARVRGYQSLRRLWCERPDRLATLFGQASEMSNHLYKADRQSVAMPAVTEPGERSVVPSCGGERRSSVEDRRRVRRHRGRRGAKRVKAIARAARQLFSANSAFDLGG